jgi:putative glutamine amidotransferase
LSKKILVVNGPGYGRALEGLGEIVSNIQEFTENPENYKLVLFSGGADVSPSLYGHTSPNNLCGTNPDRDVQEAYIFKVALEHGIPMVGICRGSQLLNVLSGGVMIHHLDHHGSEHPMTTASGEIIRVTSTHHQMSVPSDKGHIIAWSTERRSKRYYGDKDLPIKYTGPEVEAIYYPDTKVFAVQYHPEYMTKDSAGYNWFRTGALDLMTLSEAEFKKKYVAAEAKSISA